jgi:sugar/nucleoside kinase (ribokinase family)
MISVFLNSPSIDNNELFWVAEIALHLRLQFPQQNALFLPAGRDSERSEITQKTQNSGAGQVIITKGAKKCIVTPKHINKLPLFHKGLQGKQQA